MVDLFGLNGYGSVLDIGGDSKWNPSETENNLFP